MQKTQSAVKLKRAPSADGLRAKAKAELKYMKWLVDKRNESQKSCHALLVLLRKYTITLREDQYSSAAQSLVGAAFSLWRAVFLAEEKSETRVSLMHSKIFLEKVVRTNAVAFSNEIDANEWTFDYYFHNARYRLVELRSKWPELMTSWIGLQTDAMGRWEYAQRKLDEAINNFTVALAKRSKSRKTAALRRR